MRSRDMPSFAPHIDPFHYRLTRSEDNTLTNSAFPRMTLLCGEEEVFSEADQSHVQDFAK